MQCMRCMLLCVTLLPPVFCYVLLLGIVIEWGVPRVVFLEDVQ